MTTTWLCGDLPAAVAEAIARGTMANLAGACPVDEHDREGAYALLGDLDADDLTDATVQDLLQRLAPPLDPYPMHPHPVDRQRQGAP